MSALPKKLYTLEQYLELDKNSEEKYEFFDGEVFAMAGGSLEHNTISANVIRSLGNKLEGTACRVLSSDMRLKVPLALPYRYPDATVVCGEPVIEKLQGQPMLLNPVLIVEVLSDSTEAYDLGKKFTAYQSIESFREYLLIAQDRPHVIQYVQQEGGKWLRSEHHGLDAVLELEALDFSLPLNEIYQRVTFA
ncbi:MAG: Uma2 family endonuclease [Acidobacteria bacterium]|nr:Uma2 family endonuclease [Acidobacteriota bacterium]MBI3421831.1 Uma2 family endonuclease [Acidobacteriota bacterium]